MDNTLYTNEIRQYVVSRDWPKGFILEIVEYDSYLGFRVFRDNFVTFSGEEQYQIAMCIKQVMERLRSTGIPCYMEKVEKVSNGRSGVAQ